MTQDKRGCGCQPDKHGQFFSSWAVAFREGVVDEVVSKLDARRRKVTEAERKKARAAQRAAEGAASSATALTLSTFVDAEHDANIDFMYGEGTSAEWAAERACRAADLAAEEARLAQLARDDPAAYAEAERERRKRERRRSGRAAPARHVDRGGYWAGREAGEGVGIDQQADTRHNKRLAGRQR
jgi:hypothetical protein